MKIFFLLIVSISFSDCPNGKLDKKKFLEVYKVDSNILPKRLPSISVQKFYPEGKAESFCIQVFKTFGKSSFIKQTFDSILDQIPMKMVTSISLNFSSR